MEDGCCTEPFIGTAEADDRLLLLQCAANVELLADTGGYDVEIGDVAAVLEVGEHGDSIGNCRN
jgi:hypothetical protein